jgi:hypothetical protein
MRSRRTTTGRRRAILLDLDEPRSSREVGGSEKGE